jgi:hypothetical protein
MTIYIRDKMIVINKTTKFRNASEFRLNNLRRMTDHSASRGLSVSYSFTNKAAELIDRNPHLLLHDRVYINGAGTFLYEVKGEPVCAFSSGETQMPVGGAFHKEVKVCLPEELGDRDRTETISVDGKHRSPLFPFELNGIKRVVETSLRQGEGAYVSKEFPGAVYQGACPFSVYETLHTLMSGSSLVAAKLSSAKRVLEVGGGLSILSFIFSQLNENGSIVHSDDIDPKLVIWANKMQKHLQSRLGYDLSRVRIRQRDVTKIGIGEYDLLMGWFPIGVPYNQLHSIFMGLKPGALVLQFFDDSYNPAPLQNGSAGFGRISNGSSSCSAFERV